MTMTGIRRGVTGVLLLAQVACAAQGARSTPAPHVTGGEQERCERLATAEEMQASEAYAKSGRNNGIGAAIMLSFMAPGAIFVLLPLAIIESNKGWWKEQARARKAGLGDCLATIVMARAREPGDPVAARALAELAWRHVGVSLHEEAESLYARATAIAEQAGDPAVLADVLEHHGFALDRMNRKTEAAALMEQARSLRPKPADPATTDDATPAGG